MKRILVIIVSLALAMTLALNSGCNVGGANIRLEGISLGTITMNGKPVQGLPSDKIDLLLQVATKEITVKYDADGAVLISSQSGATVEIKAGSILISGIKSEQIKVEWAVSKQD